MATFLLSLLPVFKKYWKPIALVLTTLAVVWYVWSAITNYGQERYDAGFALRDQQYRVELDKLREQYRVKLETMQRTNDEIVTKLNSAQADIRNRPPGRPVWVCDAPAIGVPVTPGDSGARGADGAPAQGLPQAPGRDLGPFFYHEADDADSIAVQLELLQEWVSKTCLSQDNLRTAF